MTGSRSFDLYRRRHAGRTPRRVMVHKTTEFKTDEAIDLVQIVEDVRWLGVRIDSGANITGKGKAAAFPVSRGTLISLGPYEALLWTHGDVQGVNKRDSFFQGARSTPRPLRPSASACACYAETLGQCLD